MSESYIKLFRKTKNNGILKDHKAWALFTWILLSVDRRTGIYTTGRYVLSEALDINPNTIYSVLLRLAKNWKVVTLKSNNKFTEISVLNWDKYQQSISPSTQGVNNGSTSNQHQINTKQEVREVENTNKNYENEQKSDDFSDLKRDDVKEWQTEALRIIEKLGIPAERHSAYFKVVKNEPRGFIADAYSFAVDHPKTNARDKMFFWRLIRIKKEKLLGGLKV